MANYAELDENNIVIRVISINDKYEYNGEEYCNSLFGGRWIQTSYNNNIRKNYAGPGYEYNENLDAFIPPKPYNSWVLDEETCIWKSPIEVPNDYFDDYEWIESDTNWFSIRKYVQETYGNSYNYTDIQECCERFNLVDKTLVPILIRDNYVVSFEKVQNFILSHVIYDSWTASVAEQWSQDYIENIIKVANCDLYAVWSSNDPQEIQTLQNYAQTQTDFTQLEIKNNWFIFKRDKYVE